MAAGHVRACADTLPHPELVGLQRRGSRERGPLTVWFDPRAPWHAAPSSKRVGQAVHSDAAIQACLTITGLFGLPLRQVSRCGATASPPANGFVASLLKLAGLDWPVPDSPTLCRRQGTLPVQLPCRGGADPLHLLVDSTGVKGSLQENDLRIRWTRTGHERGHAARSSEALARSGRSFPGAGCSSTSQE